jgi:diguanylate cyclase (GGDEF)-like protein/PAS domain S-box-containing protein
VSEQLEELLEPVVNVTSVYLPDLKVLRVREIKARPKAIDLVIGIAGRKFLSTDVPVDDAFYQRMILDNGVGLARSFEEVTNSVVSGALAATLGKTLKINCFLAIAYIIDGIVYGTTTLALEDEPHTNIVEILRTFAYFTAVSLKKIKSEQALSEREKELLTVTDNMTDLVSMTDAEGRFVYLTGLYKDLLGYSKEELIGRSVFDLVYKDDLPHVFSRFKEAIAEKKSDQLEFRAVRNDGNLVWVETIGNLLIDGNGAVTGAVFTTRNINERKKAEEALRRSEEHLQAIADSLDGILYAVDSDLCYTFSKGRKLSALGLRQDEYVGKTMYEWFETEDPEHPTIKAHLQALTGEVVQLEAVRGDSVFSTVLSPLHDESGSIVGVAGLLTDITEQKKAYERIRHMSYHDQLTDLYNRHYFEHIKKELKELPVISVIMTDINGLKLINDTYGHETGDELLKEYARILKKSFKKSDLIFRWGGDEFVVVLKNTAEATSWDLCNRLIRQCSESLVRELPLSISVGISSKRQGEDVDRALPEAENMMYKNKLNESKSSKNLIMKTLLHTLSEKSFETKEHIERMSDIGKRLGLSLNLPPSELSRLNTLIMLHDIGKINIDSHILLKETSLSEVEWAEIKKHPEVGFRITRTAEEFAYVAEEILSHHERWDGLGYPQGLAGESIPYLARILALIDSYDVMRNGRPYKKKMTIEEIVVEIKRCAGKHFDPELAQNFINFILDENDK